MNNEFIEKYIEDASELVDNLELKLLEIETSSNSQDSVDEVFRIMHTLKGVSAMYGYFNIEKLTHRLETVFDYIREDKLNLDKEIVINSLKSIDVLKNLLRNSDKLDESNQKILNDLLDILSNICSDLDTSNSNTEKNEVVVEQNNVSCKTFYIKFVPESNLFKRGINPLFFFEDLNNLGKCNTVSYIQNIPKTNNIDIKNCYISWLCILSTEKTINDLEDIFIFASDEVEIKQLSSNNLLKSSKFIESIEKQTKTNKIPEFSEIKQITDNINIAIDNISLVKRKKEKKLDKIQIERVDIIKVKSEKLDILMNLIGELVTTKSELQHYANLHKDKNINELVEKLVMTTNDISENVLNIRMIPLTTLQIRFQRLVYDLSRELNKKVEFVVDGLETEIDKTIIDKLEGPIMHLIRNCIDHGIELPDERLKKNKEEKGIIKLFAYQSGSNIFIQIQDDGKGIDIESVKNRAIEKRIINETKIMSIDEIYDLMFIPGFSTNFTISTISGRGVGLDIVKRVIKELHGEIKVDSEQNLGTSFNLKIPLSLSIIECLHIMVGNQNFLLPILSVDNCININEAEFYKSKNNYIKFNKNLIPYIYLRKEFKIEEKFNSKEKIIIVKQFGKKIAIIADKIIGEHHAVIKSIDSIFLNQNFIIGSSILGNGKIGLIIDINNLSSSLNI